MLEICQIFKQKLLHLRAALRAGAKLTWGGVLRKSTPGRSGWRSFLREGTRRSIFLMTVVGPRCEIARPLATLL